MIIYVICRYLVQRGGKREIERTERRRVALSQLAKARDTRNSYNKGIVPSYINVRRRRLWAISAI
jgi:hypothetical protein